MKRGRKRKLIMDAPTYISDSEMKSQLSYTKDIVNAFDFSPPTKKIMYWRENGGIEKLFGLPGHPILSKALFKLFSRHLTTRSSETFTEECRDLEIKREEI